MAIWTVETWRVAPEREAHFLGRCSGLSPGGLILYRDLEEEGLFWSPAKWEDMEALGRWHATRHYRSVLRELEDDVVEHQIHVMTDVPGFLPQADGPNGRGDPTP
jgi:hypothetical protein